MTLVCRVRKKGVTVLVDAMKVFSWDGPYSKLSMEPVWKIPNPQALFVGGRGVDLTWSRISITPVSGQGKRLR